MARRPRLLGVRVALLLTAGAALLSFFTGVVNIGTGGFVGPLSEYIPPVVQQTAGFTGTLTGFLMLASAYGLRRGYRAGWRSTMLLLPITAAQGIVQTSVAAIPLVVLSLVALPVVGINRRAFDRELDLSTSQLAALAAIVGVQVYGTVGTYALREDFTGVNTLLDAFYYTIVTASTVGYGDATPVGPRARLFGMSVVVLGTASFAIALGSLLGPAIEARLSRALGTMTETRLDLLEDHVIVVGYGELTEPMLEEFAETVNCIVITPSSEDANTLRDHDYEVMVADPSDEEPLQRAGIERARALVAATNDDASDAMAILTARELNPDLHIVAAATDRQNIKKLRRAGADVVMSPAVLGGHMLVESALERGDMAGLADHILGGNSSEDVVQEAEDDDADAT